jgi:hypothetical protein
VSLVLVVPFALQVLAMSVDELWFHRRRGLPRWERIGHPIDTLSVIACITWSLAAPFQRRTVIVYVGLAIFSCVLITKDERVHAARCSPKEHWLHAVLFVLHPIVLACVALSWATGARFVLVAQLVVTALAALHQTLYWNVAWARR